MALRQPRHQRLPASGERREALREKGQFWTPPWVAEAMSAYVLLGGSRTVFDPAVGGGAFFRAAKQVASELGRTIQLLGAELYADTLIEAATHGLSSAELSGVAITDFVRHPPESDYRAIVANPPYIRHHRMSPQLKAFVREIGARMLGRPLDGRAGLHVYFLLRALELSAPDGRLAFILPADSCEGVFAGELWRWVTSRFRMDAIITFDHEATPFPGVDTNAIVFLIRNSAPGETFPWVRCHARGGALKQWVMSDRPVTGSCAGLSVSSRPMSEALVTGLSRPPADPQEGPTLLDAGWVNRGIATGGNEFFFLTRARANELRIPNEFLRLAIGRTRDLSGDVVTPETLSSLEKAGRPTLLLALDGRPISEFPAPVRAYLREGERAGFPERALIRTRSPWYKMESRSIPPFLFAYLGRRSARFIRNMAGCVPLTGFLCVYSRNMDPTHLDRLWRVLNHPDTIENLKLVGKSYGGGAIKVEPRGLERLRLPADVLSEAGIEFDGVEEQLSLV